MSSPCFRFKQFTVWHDRCAMKVGTDGVLLGAWCSQLGSREKVIDHKGTSRDLRILDVGTGSGLAALMLAQTYPEARIDAIDIAPESIEQAEYNFRLSPWAERVNAHLCSLQEWQGEYDLIVSNPPYFVDSLKNPEKGREWARHTGTLEYHELLQHSLRMLAPRGSIAYILPAAAKQPIGEIAHSMGLAITHIVHIYSKPGKENPIRILINLQRKEELSDGIGTQTDTLYIESAHSPRSEEYADWTKDFYL